MISTAPQPRDERFIVLLHPTIWLPCRDTLYRCRAEELPIGITQGLRTWGEQDGLFVQGRRDFCVCPAIRGPHAIRAQCNVIKEPRVTDAPGGSSWHNFGLAFDVAFDDDPGPGFLARWPNDVAAWDRVGEIGKFVGLEWGGDWPGKGKQDRPHFQWLGDPRLTLGEARGGKRPTRGPF